MKKRFTNFRPTATAPVVFWLVDRKLCFE